MLLMAVVSAVRDSKSKYKRNDIGTRPKKDIDEEKVKQYSVEMWVSFPRIVLELYTNRLGLAQGNEQVMATDLHNYFNPSPSQEEEASEEEMDEVVISQVEGRTSEGEGNQDDKDIDLEINRDAEVTNTKESNGAMLAKGKRKMRSNG